MYTLFAHHTTAHNSNMTSVVLLASLVVIAALGVAAVVYVTQRKDK
jgi:hypothetical protein